MFFVSLVGINIFLEGFIRTENLRFRDVALTFKVVETASEEEVKRLATHDYPAMKKQLGNFNLTVDAGSFTESEIIVLLGENGTGMNRIKQKHYSNYFFSRKNNFDKNVSWKFRT